LSPINVGSREGSTIDEMPRLARPGPKGLKNRLGWAGPCFAIAFCLPSGFALAADAPIDAAAALTKYRCYTCHSDQESLAGPAFADVAARYRDRKDAVSHVAQEIATGVRTGGPWHMPPHPEVSRNEARAMARYIMSLGDKGVHPQATDRR
jgi:cytochrome c